MRSLPVVIFLVIVNCCTVFASVFDVQPLDIDCTVENYKTVNEYHQQLKQYVSLLDKISTSFNGRKDLNDLFLSSLKVVLNKIDPHAEVFTAGEFKEFENKLDSYLGIGVATKPVTSPNKGLKIIELLENYPAIQAGLKVRDVIIKVNDSIITSSVEMHAAIAQSNQKSVSVTILRKNKELNFEVPLKLIKYPTVHLSLVKDRYLYIKITSFSSSTVSDLESKLNKFLADNVNKEYEGLIVDLRYNAGGLLSASVDTAGLLFGNEYPIGSSHTNFYRQIYKSTKDAILDLDTWNNIQKIVLVNNYTASAAEFLAGYMRDQVKAIVVGNPTIGKGLVQSVTKVGDVYLKLSTGRTITPKNLEIQGIGIIPDFWINNEYDLNEITSNSYAEVDHDVYIENSQFTKDEIKKMRSYDDNLKHDNYLSLAVNLLDFMNKFKIVLADFKKEDFINK